MKSCTISHPMLPFFSSICCGGPLTLYVIFESTYKPRRHSMLIPRILHQDVVGHGIEVVQAHLITVLGAAGAVSTTM